METILKLILVIYTAAEMVLGARTDTSEIIAALLLFVLAAYNTKFRANPATLAAMSALCGYMASRSETYLALFCFPLFDIMLTGRYYLLSLPALAAAVSGAAVTQAFAGDALLYAFASACGFWIRRSGLKEKQIYLMFDKERNRRYEMEKTQDELLGMNREIAQMARLKERNRIARDIHDNVGHRLAAVIIHLRALKKICGSEPETEKAMLEQGITQLSESMELLRETVHNIKPAKSMGIEQIREITEGFRFCPVELKTEGDFSNEEPYHINILAKNLREALTNTAKHSDAGKVEVRLESAPRYLRMIIKDDGTKGGGNIKEGLGLSGMRERLQNAGGTFSYGFSGGFVQASFIPRERKEL